jgi:L-alanine-DL-glutamate epimerase-like enolase superfamily enzyme
MSATIKAAAAVALLFGSALPVLAAHSEGKITRQVHRVERVTPPTFDGRDVEVPPLPNWGFGCDPDFGPNGYNPCSRNP